MKIKKYFLIIILLELLFSFSPVLAADAVPDYTQGNKNPVSSQIEQYLCAPTDASKTAGNAASGDLNTCINKLYKFSIIFASAIAVFFIVIAGYVYMSAEGNSESVEKAKSILTSSIVALVILFSAYLLLKALNPDLISLKTFQPVTVLNPPIDIPAGGTVSPGSLSSAQQLLNLNGSKITISNSGSCAGNSPLVNLKAIAAGQPAAKDGPGSACNQGTTGIEPAMLNALVSVANAGLPITVTSLTSGHHASANDPHYAGLAVDLVPQNLQANGQAILNALVQGGAAKVAVECNLGGTAQFIVIYSSAANLTSVDASKCTGQPNYHWHAQWGSANSTLNPE